MVTALQISSRVEDAPGATWAAHARALWPGYRTWFLSEGEQARPTYLATVRAMRAHMPELVPVYEQLVELVGGSDLQARCLGLYCPPPFVRGCSQAVWTRGEPLLVRNYDFVAELWEQCLLQTSWLGRPVLGMSDCLWGLLDGVNQAGLCLSLAFGGSRDVGTGFGVPLIVRYVLETCATCAEAVAALRRIPCHMAYNITVLDATGAHATVFVGPDRDAEVTSRRVITNHQGTIAWQAHAEATGSVDRLRVLTRHLDGDDETEARFVQRFLEPPTYSHAHARGFGTLYTAVYRPVGRTLQLLWPSARWDLALGSIEERTVSVVLP